MKRIRYICYGKTRKQTECDGQTGYTAHILDGIVDKVIRKIFDRMWLVPQSDVVNDRYREKMQERRVLMEAAGKAHEKAADELATLKAEVVKAIRGESAFDTGTLSGLIREAEDRCAEALTQYEDAKAAYAEGQAVMDSLNKEYEMLIGWSELYELANIETKKMIVNALIRRIDVYRGYRVHIDFNIDFDQFRYGLDLRGKTISFEDISA